MTIEQKEAVIEISFFFLEKNCNIKLLKLFRVFDNPPVCSFSKELFRLNWNTLKYDLTKFDAVENNPLSNKEYKMATEIILFLVTNDKHFDLRTSRLGFSLWLTNKQRFHFSIHKEKFSFCYFEAEKFKQESLTLKEGLDYLESIKDKII